MAVCSRLVLTVHVLGGSQPDVSQGLPWPLAIPGFAHTSFMEGEGLRFDSVTGLQLREIIRTY